MVAVRRSLSLSRGLWALAMLAVLVPVAADGLCAGCRGCRAMGSAPPSCHADRSAEAGGAQLTSPCGFAAPMAVATGAVLPSATVVAPALAVTVASLPAPPALLPVHPASRAASGARCRDVPLYTLLAVLLI